MTDTDAASRAFQHGPLFIVMNAGSGKRDAESARETIAARLNAAGCEHEFLLAEQPDQLSRLAQQAVERAKARNGVVVAAGGDGTINTVVQQTLGSGQPFAVLPQGTFNFFGRNYGIPADAEGAVQALLESRPRQVQVGLVNERVFLINASLGLYPEVLEDRETFKQKLGRKRIVALWSGVYTLLREHRLWTLDLNTGSEQRLIRTPTLFVGNNPLQLEKVGIPQSEALEQERLAGVVLRPVGKLGMLTLMVKGALGQLGEAENLDHFAFRELLVRPRSFSTRIKVAVDGEIAWMKPPLRFRPSPQTLTLLAPDREPIRD